MQVINIRNLIVKQLLFQLNQQYENGTFEINQCLRHATQYILSQSSKFHQQFKEQQIVQIRTQLTLFMYSLVKAPSIWANMLRNDQISSSTTEIIINQTETLTKIYRQILKQTNYLIKQSKLKAKNIQNKIEKNQQKTQTFDFQKQYLNQATKSMIAFLLNNLASQICRFYKKGKDLLQNQQKIIQQSIKKSQIMNPYLLFGMLKQISSYTYQKIQGEMTQYFKNLPADTIHNFCRYVQKNYQFVQLKCEQGKITKIYTDEQMQKHIAETNEFWLNFLSKLVDDQVTLKKVKSTKGDNAVMLIRNKNKKEEQQDLDENQQNFNDAQKIILKIGADNKIQVTNSRISQKKWELFTMKDTVSGLYRIMKKQIAQQAGNAMQKQIFAYGVPMGQYTNLGGSIGKCLADINKYKDANHFLKDLSKNTIIGGSITYILTKVPILSYFMIAGGFTYTFYHTWNNKTTSNRKKVRQVGKVTVTAVGSVGSAVAGSMLGQALIPVPFLGAFVGGVIGGFLGQTGTKLMNKVINKQSFKLLIKNLKSSLVDNIYWKYTPKLLDQLGINSKYFNQQFCKQSSQKDAYITSICFCIASIYQTKRYIARNQQKMKQLQNQKQKQIKIQTILEEQQNFDNQFNIVGIVDYLTVNKVILLEEHNKLQECIRHIIVN